MNELKPLYVFVLRQLMSCLKMVYSGTNPLTPAPRLQRGVSCLRVFNS